MTGECWTLGRRPALDGLRGIAALLVVATHAAAFLLPPDRPEWLMIQGARLGVDLFFVLSGVLITTLLLQEHQRTGRIDIRSFYMRRARRLFPAAFTLLGCWLVFRALFGDPLRELLRTALVILTYSTDYYKTNARDITPGLGHFWTLAVEEQFYLLWPVLLLVLLRRRVSLKMIAVGAVALAGVVVVHRAMLLTDLPTFDVVFRADAHCDGLMLGVAVAAAWRCGWIRPARVARWGWPALIAFLALALALPGGVFEGWTSSLVYAGAAVLSAVVICAALEPTRGYSAVLASAPSRFLGRISYSLYLWHVPVIVVLMSLPLATAVKLVLAFVLSLTTAAASHRAIERPFMHRKVDGGRTTSTHAAPGIPTSDPRTPFSSAVSGNSVGSSAGAGM